MFQKLKQFFLDAPDEDETKLKENEEKQYPSSNAATVFRNAADQFETGLKLGEKITLTEIALMQHLTFVGMGGSLHAPFLLQTYLENTGCQKQVNLIRDYQIPAWVSKKGQLFIISYSGNTAETLAAYTDAQQKGYKIIVFTAGGRLKELAENDKTPLVILPQGYQPRYSVFFVLGALTRIFQSAKIMEIKQEDLEATIRVLKNPVFETMGKQLAEALTGKVPLLYTSPKLGTLGLRWKIAFNENAKVHAFCNQIPELNHNEINGYVARKENFHCLLLIDQEEKPEHKKRIAVTKQLIKENGYPATELVIKGPNYFSRLLSAISFGDWTSYYCATALGIDPEKVEVIDRLKGLLEEERK